jgi:hypothetical protein
MEQQLTQLKQRSRTANGSMAVPFEPRRVAVASSFEHLRDFIRGRMRMAHIYQPVMIKELLQSGGKASIRNIVAVFLSRAQLEYYEQITRNMPGKVLGSTAL